MRSKVFIIILLVVFGLGWLVGTYVEPLWLRVLLNALIIGGALVAFRATTGARR